MMLSIFSCTYLPLCILFGEVSVQIFCLVFLGLFVIPECEESLHILGTYLFLEMYFANNSADIGKLHTLLSPCSVIWYKPCCLVLSCGTDASHGPCLHHEMISNEPVLSLWTWGKEFAFRLKQENTRLQKCYSKWFQETREIEGLELRG